MSRPDDLRWVYAVQPAFSRGALSAVLTVLVVPLVSPRCPSDVLFWLFFGTLLLATTVVSLWRIARRERNPHLYRAKRPQGASLYDDWRYAFRMILIGLLSGAVVLAVSAWFGLLTPR